MYILHIYTYTYTNTCVYVYIYTYYSGLRWEARMQTVNSIQGVRDFCTRLRNGKEVYLYASLRAHLCIGP